MIKIADTISRSYNAPVIIDAYPMFEWIPGLEIKYNENINNDMEVEEINERDIQA